MNLTNIGHHVLASTWGSVLESVLNSVLNSVELYVRDSVRSEYLRGSVYTSILNSMRIKNSVESKYESN
jgi:hypothetical protein